jgi:hypothetical protein
MLNTTGYQQRLDSAPPRRTEPHRELNLAPRPQLRKWS